MTSLYRMTCTAIVTAAAFCAIPAAAKAPAYAYDVGGSFAQSGARGITCADGAGNRPGFFRTIGTPACSISAVTRFKPNDPPVCGGFSIGPIADWISTYWHVTEQIVLSQCSDSDGGTLSVVSPSMPYDVQIPAYAGSFYVYFTVSDGQGGTAQMWVYVMHS